MSKLYLGLFVLSILVSAFSQILLKKGSSRANIYLNLYTITGYGLMFLSTIFTLIAYKYINLSLGQLLQALSFVFVTILSYIFLKEKITFKKIIGIIIIVLGIFVFSI